jgi:hypothetical protein
MVQSRCSQKYLTPGILGVENTPVFVQKAHADSNNLSRYRYSSFCPSVFVSYKAAVILRIRQSSKYPSADVDAKVLKCVEACRTRITSFLFWTEPVTPTEHSDPIQPNLCSSLIRHSYVMISTNDSLRLASNRCC